MTNLFSMKGDLIVTGLFKQEDFTHSSFLFSYTSSAAVFTSLCLSLLNLLAHFYIKTCKEYFIFQNNSQRWQPCTFTALLPNCFKIHLCCQHPYILQNRRFISCSWFFRNSLSNVRNISVQWTLLISDSCGEQQFTKHRWFIEKLLGQWTQICF